MKKIIGLLVFCLIGCESKTEKEIKELDIRKTELTAEVQQVNQTMVAARKNLAKVYTETADTLERSIANQDRFQRKMSELILEEVKNVENW